MNGPFRLESGGRIDRDRTLTFGFDGKPYQGHPGDTLASALLAAGVRCVGRSFKYHRPRGVFTAGSEEPNALVTIGRGAEAVPNTRATMIELADGLEACSQNRWPSLGFDVLAVNGLLSPLLAAGFYYKTFMWPRSWWERVYEPAIRRAAGLGHASRAPDPDRYEHVHAHCDVLVVGGGPAGLMAALAAAESGARVILADEQPWLGGALLHDREVLDGGPAEAWLARAAARLDAAEHVRVLRRTTVFGFYDDTVLAAIERAGAGEGAWNQPRQRLWTIRPREVVLAAGSHERPLLFPDNDRPGVMPASAVRRYLHHFAVAAGRRVAVVTNNDDAYRTALDLHAAGVAVPAVADLRPEPGPAAETARAAGLDVIAGAVPAGVGGGAVRALHLTDVRGGRSRRVACDAVAVSGGYVPAVHLAGQSGATPVWDAALQALVPGTPVQRERSAGAARGVFGLRACLEDGASAGREAARAAGCATEAETAVPVADERPESAIGPVPMPDGRGKVFVDLQTDVTAADLRLAVREGYGAPEHAKRYTTLGMGVDQGKTAALNGLAVLADAQGLDIATLKPTTIRPPYAPVAIGAFAGHHRGKAFQPTRRTALHGWHTRNGAVFVEAGLWLRPQYYPRPGEDLMAACVREARQVRASVGLCDVSTLGRIEIFGPDAAEFLNRLYINGWTTLPVGRARYGLMLREDGHAFDDGTTSRLADDHYLMTTTTANAAAVLAHMEKYHQCHWPELDVCFCSATEQWCAMALAGPRARDVLAAVVDGADVSNEALPHLGVTEATAAGAPLRIFRISFSGELAYELNTPWGYGEGLWERCLVAGAPCDITPYGVEALSILRIEKGHPAGQEFDGRTTAADLGMARLMSTRKAFIGRTMATERPGMVEPSRPTLVGLTTVDRAHRLRGGAQLVEDPRTATSETALGWVSSVHFSPALDRWIGLGFVQGGRDRRGTALVAAYPLKNEWVPVEIVEPCFVDPEGERLRA